MTVELITPSEIEKLMVPPTMGEVTYERDGSLYSLKIRNVGDGYELSRISDKHPKGFHLLFLKNGDLVVNDDSIESQNEVDSIFNDVRAILQFKKA